MNGFLQIGPYAYITLDQPVDQCPMTAMLLAWYVSRPPMTREVYTYVFPMTQILFPPPDPGEAVCWTHTTTNN